MKIVIDISLGIRIPLILSSIVLVNSCHRPKVVMESSRRYNNDNIVLTWKNASLEDVYSPSNTLLDYYVNVEVLFQVAQDGTIVIIEIADNFTNFTNLLNDEFTRNLVLWHLTKIPKGVMTMGSKHRIRLVARRSGWKMSLIGNSLTN